MNRSFSKRRHIEEANQKMEKRVLKEQTTSGQTQTNQEQMTKLVNDIGKEGLKNVTPEMIAEPPFDGELFGYSFSGVFKNVKYSWLGIDVDGLPGIRGRADGKIISEKNSFLPQQTGKQVPDADPNGVFVGFMANNGFPKFVVYMTKEKKPKALQF